MADYKFKNVKKGWGIIGLMFKTKITEPYSFTMSSIDKSLHTFFCFCDMDAVCLDENGHVVQKLHMPQWKYFVCHKDTTDVIEGPVGAFSFLELGDYVQY